jgi:hypothetical protein
VTIGGSSIKAIAAVRGAGHEAMRDATMLARSRAACGRSSTGWRAAPEAIAQAAAGWPFEPLSTIDDVYPERSAV